MSAIRMGIMHAVVAYSIEVPCSTGTDTQFVVQLHAVERSRSYTSGPALQPQIQPMHQLTYDPTLPCIVVPMTCSMFSSI